MGKELKNRPARYSERQVPDYNTHKLGDLLGGVLDAGKRQSSKRVQRSKRFDSLDGENKYSLHPTNSERMNRALKELSTSAFKVHMLLWQWRGAPARGHLPFFTIHSLSKFCALTRPTVRKGLDELIRKGWIHREGYSRHKKNELYKLVPIRDVPNLI